MPVLVRGSVIMKRYHDHGSSYKGKHLIGVAYISRGLVHYHHSGHGSMQTDMVLEKKLHLDPAGNRMWSGILGMALAYMRPQSLPHSDTLPATRP